MKAFLSIIVMRYEVGSCLTAYAPAYYWKWVQFCKISSKMFWKNPVFHSSNLKFDTIPYFISKLLLFVKYLKKKLWFFSTTSLVRR